MITGPKPAGTPGAPNPNASRVIQLADVINGQGMKAIIVVNGVILVSMPPQSESDAQAINALVQKLEVL